MKIITKLVTSLLFVSALATPAFAHHGKAHKDRSAASTGDRYGYQGSAGVVQESRSLKHKYLTRTNSVATPTSPSTKTEFERRSAAVESYDDNRIDSRPNSDTKRDPNRDSL